jgi:hypothetical protein
MTGVLDGAGTGFGLRDRLGQRAAHFGGTAQLVVTWLLHVTGNPLAPAWYLLLAAIVGLVAMSLMPETAPVKKRQGLA